VNAMRDVIVANFAFEKFIGVIPTLIPKTYCLQSMVVMRHV
jgi:hypothetical protein